MARISRQVGKRDVKGGFAMSRIISLGDFSDLDKISHNAIIDRTRIAIADTVTRLWADRRKRRLPRKTGDHNIAILMATVIR